MNEVLVLTQGYPSKADTYNLAYIHTRNLQYLEYGIQAIVLNFGATSSYEWQGIPVYTEKDLLKQNKHWSLILSHAPNIRNHLRFLSLHKKSFQHCLFFIHGHEVLIKSGYYPKPYAFSKQSNQAQQWISNLYDHVKVRLLKSFFKKNLGKNRIDLIFVSQWMQNAFFDCIKIPKELVLPFSHIIPNSLHPNFMTQKYRQKAPQKADFITIRPLDNPKYAIDIVYQLALNHPQLTFAVYGKGSFFEHHTPPPNLRHFPNFLTPREITEILPHYRCALMPTRLDAQGVMMCEMAAFGMPLISSDLPICHEMLSQFKSIGFIDNTDSELEIELPDYKEEYTDLAKQIAEEKFGLQKTIEQEVALIQQHL